MANDGFNYTLHFCRGGTNRNPEYIISVRVKCIQHKKKKCRSSFNAKLLRDWEIWHVTGNIIHNHPEERTEVGAFIKRYDRIFTSLSKIMPPALRKKFVNEFKRHNQEQETHVSHQQDSRSYDLNEISMSMSIDAKEDEFAPQFDMEERRDVLRICSSYEL